MPLDEWQEQALEAAMGERSDGRWASKYVGISAPRQNGKSQLIVARALAGVLLFGEKMVIVSAHETDTAREIWKRMIDVIEDNPTLEKRLTGRMDAINREYVSFGQGADRQTIKLKARGQSGARGFSADCLLLDEGQILGKRAWGSINPTMSAMPNPQLWLFGTPPTDTDDPFAFNRVRENAIAGKARHCWLEWSASENDDIDAPETWAKANPAYGVRISYEACADDRAAMDAEQFCVERLGMWQADAAAKVVIPAALWNSLRAVAPPDDGVPPVALGLDRWHDGSTAVSAAWRTDDSTHVELIASEVVEETAGTLAWLVERAGKRIPVAVASDSPAAALIPDLKRHGVQVVTVNSNEFQRACVGFLDDAYEERLTHADQGPLTVAMMGAKKRYPPRGGAGLWTWDRRSPDNDISPLVSATLARFAAAVHVVDKPSPVFAF